METTEVSKVNEKRAISNSDGAYSWIRDMDELKASVAVTLGKISHLQEENAHFREKTSRHEERTSSLEAEVLSLHPFKRFFVNVRERAFLAYVRQFWDDYGQSRYFKRPPSSEEKAAGERISDLNRNILHG